MSQIYVPPTTSTAAPAPAPAPTPVPAQSDANPTVAGQPQVEAPARTPTPLEEFHPALDPSKVSMSFDPISGKLRLAPIEESVPSDVADSDAPDQTTASTTTPAAPTPTDAPAAPTTEITELKGQLAQMANLVTAMAQAQLAGKPLSEILGQPAPPAAPDYTNVDMYDPLQAAELVRSVVRAEIQNSMQTHQPTLEAARRRQELESVQLKHGTDPAFHNKSIAAMQLVQKNPALTIDAAYDIVASIATTLQPTQSTPAPAQTPAQPATRTITQDQAAQKADQAKRLPSNSGVRGEGKSGPPAHIKGLGQMIAWEMQQASLNQ